MGFHFLFYILIFIYFFKYETIVSRNGLSLGYSERDTSSVKTSFINLLRTVNLILLVFWLLNFIKDKSYQDWKALIKKEYRSLTYVLLFFEWHHRIILRNTRQTPRQINFVFDACIIWLFIKRLVIGFPTRVTIYITC